MMEAGRVDMETARLDADHRVRIEDVALASVQVPLITVAQRSLSW